mgnify:FL=1|jgi:hypothetical protein|tara:strand:- start:98 stop:574 length:477 start_codon:yes stop_codon:yes gene_type:complete
MFSFSRPTLRVTLLGILALSAAIALHFQIKANSLYKTIIPKETTFYTPGQKDNCKWVIHVSQKITTEPGSNSPIQIGIPEVIKDGYIAGILQNAPGNSLLFALKLPTQSKNSPPLVMTHVYSGETLPLKKARFRVFNSTALTMVLYNSYDACIEATME